MYGQWKIFCYNTLTLPLGRGFCSSGHWLNWLVRSSWGTRRLGSEVRAHVGPSHREAAEGSFKVRSKFNSQSSPSRNTSASSVYRDVNTRRQSLKGCWVLCDLPTLACATGQINNEYVFSLWSCCTQSACLLLGSARVVQHRHSLCFCTRKKKKEKLLQASDLSLTLTQFQVSATMNYFMNVSYTAGHKRATSSVSLVVYILWELISLSPCLII